MFAVFLSRIPSRPLSTPCSILFALLLLTVPTLLGSGCSRSTPQSPTPANRTEDDDDAPEEDGNSRPIIKKLTISPFNPVTTDDIEARAEVEDPDGDPVTIVYQWYLNDEALLGEITETLSSSLTEAGDRVFVEVKAGDRGGLGKPRRSAPITIRNSPPVLVEKPGAGTSLDGFRFEVEDIDGDPIRFSLSGQPPNMRIDPDGTLHWQPSPDDKEGDYTVTLTADDGHGGRITIRFPVHVNPPTQ